MREKENKSSISIRNSIIIVSIVLMVTTVGMIGYIIYANWLSSADEATTIMAQEMNTDIKQQIDAFMQIPKHINQVNQNILENQIVDMTDETEREKFFVGNLKVHSTDIYSFSYGTENGEYYGARRNEKGFIEIMRNDANTNGQSWYYSINDDMTARELVLKAGLFDPRTREWYKTAKRNGLPVFSPVYKHFVMDGLTVSAAYPIYKEGKLQGVLGTHVILSSIDKYLKDIVKETNGFAVIAELGSTELIASSFDINNYEKQQDGSVKRLKLGEIENNEIQKAYEHYISTREESFRITKGSQRLRINLTELHKEGLDWIIITALPENLLMVAIIQNMRVPIILALCAILLTIAIYFLLTNKLIKPIDSLIEATQKLSLGDLTKRAPVIRNDEIGRIAKSFNNMADTMHTLVHNLESKVKERTIQLEETNETLNENKDKLRLILDSTAEGVYGVDMDGNCTFCNASCLEMLGLKHENELLGKNTHLFIHHSHRDGTSIPIKDCKVFSALKEKKGSHANDEMFWRADGTSFDVEYYSYPQYKDGEMIGAVVTFLDYTQRKKDEEEIEYLSCHDSLTGLFNRRCFEKALAKIDSEKNLPISIIFADVNGLKLTNDVFGHASGDELIIKCAEIMKNACREQDVVARVGGDEFILILPNTQTQYAENIISIIQKELSEARINAIKCSMSMGLDIKINTAQDIERTLEHAENAMYKAKTLNRKAINSDMVSTIIKTLHDRSPREKRHSESVRALCYKIGLAMGMNETGIKKLKECGFLHDIGKIVLGEDILNKVGTLKEEERKEMQQHSVVGYRILNLFDDTLDLAEGVYGHHEYWNGSGYPKGLIGKEIPMLARVIAVAEAYDAMTDNSNNMAISKEQALLEIKNQSGIKFDPEIADVFIQMMTSE